MRISDWSSDVCSSDLDDDLYGNGGNDRLYGGKGDDYLDGGSGYDRVHGGAGDDFLIGGSDKDLFVFGRGDGHDTIADFEIGKDAIDLRDLRQFDNLSDLNPLLDRTAERSVGEESCRRGRLWGSPIS